MWTVKLVDYLTLHPFGYPTYVIYNAQERTKMDPKSRRYLFLGYANGVKGNLLWDPTTHKVLINRDVIFVRDQLLQKGRDDSTSKVSFEITTIHMEK